MARNDDGVPADHVPADHVPADHVPADHVPADHVPADHVPGDHVPAGDDPAGAGGRRLSPESALHSLEERLTRASDAAERLIAEAAGAAARRPPAAGWTVPPDSGEADNGSGPHESKASDGDLAALMDFIRPLRDLIPPELQRRLGEALRELLLAVRALIDWYLERLEQRRRSPTTIEDIPIL
jgi:hypothetical protein